MLPITSLPSSSGLLLPAALLTPSPHSLPDAPLCLLFSDPPTSLHTLRPSLSFWPLAAHPTPLRPFPTCQLLSFPPPLPAPLPSCPCSCPCPSPLSLSPTGGPRRCRHVHHRPPRPPCKWVLLFFRVGVAGPFNDKGLGGGEVVLAVPLGLVATACNVVNQARPA